MLFKSKKYKKLVAAIALGFMVSSVSTPLVYADDAKTDATEKTSSSDSDTKKNLQKQLASILGATGSMPVIGSTAKVEYSIINAEHDEAKQAVPICTGTKAPTQNEKVSFKCVVTGNKIYGMALPLSTTATSSSSQSVSGIAGFQYQYTTKVKDKDGKEVNKNKVGWAAMQITVNFNAYSGSTSIGSSDVYDSWDSSSDSSYNGSSDWSSSDGSSDWSNSDGSNGSSDWSSSDGGSSLWGDGTESNAKGSNICPDGTYYCSSSSDSNTLWGDDSSSSNGGSNGYYDSNGNWHDGSGSDSGSSDGSGGYYDENGNWINSDGSSSSGSDSTYNSGSSTNYGDLLDDLLNDSNSYNSGDADWISSNGGSDGSSDLDDYLNGLGSSDADGLVDGLTDDLTGYDEDLIGSSVGTDGEDGLYGEDGTDGLNGEGGDWTSETGEDNAAVWGEDNDLIQNLMGAMDGISGEDEDGEDGSLISSLSNFLRNMGDKAGVGVTGTDVSDQELFELAKKLLLASGMNIDDILKGKSYDTGSAYTEPRMAWDMNRITTLLSKGKIKNIEVANSKDTKSSLNKSANRSKAINQAAKTTVDKK